MVRDKSPGAPVRALLIVNPKSRQGSAAELDQGVERLRQRGMKVDYLVSQSAEESRAALRERHDRIDLVIVGGGDGTIRSMAEAILEYRIALGILPLGTANDLARSLEIPSDLDDAFDVLWRNQRRHIDVGEVNGEFFFNVANLGLGVKVAEELSGETKQRWGVFSYLRALCRAIVRRDRFTATISVDGKTTKLRSMQVAVGNGRYYGGGNIVDEQASIESGLLYVYSLRPQGVLEFLTLAPLLRTGHHHDDLRVYSATGREIVVDTGHRNLEIYADGDPITRTPARFRVRPNALEVVAPTASGNEKSCP